MSARGWIAPGPPAHVRIAAAITRNRDGGTATADGRILTLPDDYPHRYVVGGVCPPELLADDADHELVRDAVDRILPSAIGAGGAVGWWTESGTTYVDVVTFHADLQAALELAGERGELAIFDAHAGEVIWAGSRTV